MSKINRFTFPQAKQFRKIVGESFLLVLREIYKGHPFYTYDDDDKKSKVAIDISYANARMDGKLPRFVIKVGSYNKDLTDYIGGNFSKEIYEDGILVGHEKKKEVRVPITVIVHTSSEEESSDLSDEMSDLFLVFGRGMFTKVGIVPVGVHVSETDVFDDQQGIYQTTIAFTADVPWVYQERYDNLVDDFNIGGWMGHDPCDTLDDLYDELGYRAPGVEVYREYIEGDDSD